MKLWACAARYCQSISWWRLARCLSMLRRCADELSPLVSIKLCHCRTPKKRLALHLRWAFSTGRT